MPIKRLAHINLGSTDLAATERFYCELLGLKKAFEFRKNGSPFGFYLDAGDTTFIEIFIQDEVTSSEQPLLRHICLEVDDIDAMIAHLRANDWQIGDKKRGVDRSWQAWTADPDGVPIELMEYTPESSQITGATCEVNW